MKKVTFGTTKIKYFIKEATEKHLKYPTARQSASAHQSPTHAPAKAQPTLLAKVQPTPPVKAQSTPPAKAQSTPLAKAQSP